MTKKMMLISGVLALVLVVGLNVRHALNDYGVKDGNLHAEVVAQSTTTGSGTGTGIGSGTGTEATHGGYNTFWDMFTHGLTKDEWSESVKCSRTTGWSINIGIWSYDDRTTIYGNKIVCHDRGYANCYSTSCE